MAQINSVKILNGQFAPVTLAEAVNWVFDVISQEKRDYICTVNVSILMMMRDSEFLQHFVDNSGLVVADGAPLIWLSSFFKQKLPERVTGVDLIDPICHQAIETNAGIYFLGATNEIITRVSESLSRKYPKLIISGVSDGYFDINNSAEIAKKVADSGAKILIVGMGVPRQEKFIQDNLDSLGVNVAIGVGGSFDVIAGLRKRAPLFIQKIGMEWAYRLIQEPKRLFKRYMLTNSKFIFLVVKTYIFRL